MPDTTHFYQSWECLTGHILATMRMSDRTLLLWLWECLTWQIYSNHENVWQGTITVTMGMSDMNHLNKPWECLTQHIFINHENVWQNTFWQLWECLTEHFYCEYENVWHDTFIATIRIINRPCVARAVLQSPPSPIHCIACIALHWLIHWVIL